jgi:hypothetical protein
LGTGAVSVLASPLLQQLLPSDLEHDFAQPDFDSLEAAVVVFAAELEQQDFAGASLVVLADVVLVLSAEVTL